jgi:hypothetical protein
VKTSIRWKMFRWTRPVLVVLAFLITLLLIPRAFNWGLECPSCVQAAQSLATIVGLVAGAAFVLFKLTSGLFLANLALEMESTRVAGDGALKDHASVTVTLRKGDRGTLIFDNIYLRVTDLPSAEKRVQRDPIRLEWTTRFDTGHLWVGRWQEDKARPFLFLTPGDAMTFSHAFEVAHGVPCLVDVVVANKTFSYWRAGQWRASCVLLPISAGSPPK